MSRAEVKRKLETLLLTIAALACGLAGPAWSAQSPDVVIARMAMQAGIVLEPIPHMEGTAPLTLPHGLSESAARIRPKGSIYVQQLQEENDYWQRMINATPRRKVLRQEAASKRKRSRQRDFIEAWGEQQTSGLIK